VGLPPAVGRTTTFTSPDLVNQNARGVVVVLDMTSAGTGSVTLSIQGKDRASGAYFTLLAGLPVTTVSTNRYRIHPNLTAAANSVAADVLPEIWRLVVTANNSNPVSWTCGATMVL